MFLNSFSVSFSMMWFYLFVYYLFINLLTTLLKKTEKKGCGKKHP